MGLDQYIYKVSAPSVAPFVYTPSAYIKGMNTISTDDFTEKEYDDIRCFARRISIKGIEIDSGKIQSDFMLPNQPYVRINGDDGPVKIICYESKFEIDLPKDVVFKKYGRVVIRDCMAIKMSELATFRKDYDLQNAMYKVKDVENCGFYIIDEEAYEEIAQSGSDFSKLFSRQEIKGGDIVYHEWY